VGIKTIQGAEKKIGGFRGAWLCFFDYSWPANLDIMLRTVFCRECLITRIWLVSSKLLSWTGGGKAHNGT